VAAAGETAVDISIVTPSFRQPEWLRLCLASVADQSPTAEGAIVQKTDVRRPVVEHVVQDACSGETVRTVCADYPHVRLFQEKDDGMYDAVNRGLRRTSGKICAYLNCDEQYLPGTLAAVEAYFEHHPEVDVLFGDVIVVNQDGSYTCSRRVLKPRRYHTQVCQLNTFTAATFFRRRILNDPALYFDTKWGACGDAGWVLTLLERGLRMAVLRRYLAVFTDTGVNMSLSDDGVQELSRLRMTAPAWTRMLRPAWTAAHRVRRLAHGLYASRPLSYSIYTPAGPQGRTRFEINEPTQLWRSRLKWLS
jgi:glycosyltransferase involved in cell wall biosynthesis